MPLPITNLHSIFVHVFWFSVCSFACYPVHWAVLFEIVKYRLLREVSLIFRQNIKFHSYQNLLLSRSISPPSAMGAFNSKHKKTNQIWIESMAKFCNQETHVAEMFLIRLEENFVSDVAAAEKNLSLNAIAFIQISTFSKRNGFSCKMYQVQRHQTIYLMKIHQIHFQSSIMHATF